MCVSTRAYPYEKKMKASNVTAPCIARYPSLSRLERLIFIALGTSHRVFAPYYAGNYIKEEGKGLSSGVRFVRKFIFRGSQKSTDYPIRPVISSLAIKLSKIVAYSF